MNLRLKSHSVNFIGSICSGKGSSVCNVLIEMNQEGEVIDTIFKIDNKDVLIDQVNISNNDSLITFVTL